MAFWRNSQYDLQSRRAVVSQDIGQWDTPLPSLIGKDKFFRGPGQAPNFDYPNPSFAVVRNAAYRAAQLAQSSDQVHQFLHELDGKDLFRGGFGKAPNWDWPNPSFVVQSRAAYQVARLAQDSTQVHPFFHGLDGKDALPVGQSTLDTRLPPWRIATRTWKAQDSVDSGLALTADVGLPPGDTICSAQPLPPAAPRAREYGQTSSFPLSLIGQDALNVGDQSVDLPPTGPARARDYSFTASFPQELIGQDQLPVGDQRVELAPRAPLRAPDYTWLWTFPQELRGQDQFTAGEQSTDLPPRGALRAREYGQASGFPLELIAQDQFNAGEQTFDLPVPAAPRRQAALEPGAQSLALSNTTVALPTGVQSTDLAPRTAVRSADYTWTRSFPLELLAQDAFNAGAQVYDLPARAPARSRDYSFAASFPPVLVAQDAVNVGDQSFALPTPARSIRQLDPGVQSLALFNTTVALPPGESVLDLPPRGPARAPDYTFVTRFPLELVGQDQRTAGQSIYDLPVPAAPRRQPALEPGVTALALSAVPIGLQVYDLAPRGPSRSADYTFLGVFPLELIGQDALTVGEQLFDLPPRAAARIQTTFEPGVEALALPVPATNLPAGAQLYDLPTPPAPKRARDYTWLQSFPLELIGKDQRNTGQSTDLTALPPKAPARSRDYSFLASFPLELNGKDAVNPGKVSTDLPPRGPARSRDYSVTASFPLELIGQDAVNAGEPSVDLPPRGPARSRDYSVTASFPLELIGQDRLPTGKQSTDLPWPPAPKRNRDYTFTFSFPLELIGKDRFNAGSQVFDLPTPARPRHQSPLEPGTDALALTVRPVFLPNGAQAFELPPIAAPRRQPALEVGAQSLALEETVAPTPTPTVPEEPKPGGKGQRRRLTRFRRGAEPRFLAGTLRTTAARLQGTLRPSWAIRAVSGWLTPASPALRLSAHALNPRHARAQLVAPAPSLLDCQQVAIGCTTLAIQASRPSLRAHLSTSADETWLLALLLSEGRDALRSWQAEATKRLSNLQRQANAHAARTDAQQERLMQASLPHLRHALMAQRDAALVALPHASKASIDPQFILDNDGFKAAVALLVQAIEDLQQAGVTLGYTDTSPSDVFDLQNPYVRAAVQTLATRISGITTTTADAIRAVIATGLDEGWTVAEMGGAIQQLGAFSDARALTIAATESRVALNTGNAASWQEMGVDQVLIADGDYDEVCAELDGSTQSLEWYMANPIGHPRCRRTGTAIPAPIPTA